MPSRDSIREEELPAYDSVVERQKAYDYSPFVKRFLHEDVLRAFPGDRMQPYFAAMLNSPLVAAGMSDLGAVYRTRGEHPDGMSHADREWVDMVLCHEVSCRWVLYVHAPDAVASGVRAGAILSLIRDEDDELTKPERRKAQFIRAVIRGTMTSDLYQSVERELGVRATVELTAFTGHLLKTMRLMQAWGIPDITQEQLDEFVTAIVDGRVELPEKPRVPKAGAPAFATKS
jgi:alkylhydroperoxidase/carboxymuconolactone decarboxylase family protein YurZ